jgi:hypothetical protein
MDQHQTSSAAARLPESKGAPGSVEDIREHMDVYASCGSRIGVVDRVEGGSIKLTKKDSPDGQHHAIPLTWVAKVHDHVHLNVSKKEAENQWQPA